MKINGLNVQNEYAIGPSIEVWLKAFNDCGAGVSFQMTNELAQPIIKAYQQSEAYTGPISKLKTDKDGNVILPEGALLHFTKPFADKEKTTIDYDKFTSISKTGLISLGMLDEDAYGWDSEVPLQASFHRCAKTQTVAEKLKYVCELNDVNNFYDIALIIDVCNDGLKKLLSYDISDVRQDVDIGNSYKTEKDKFYAFRLKKYPQGIQTETEKQALGYLLDASHPIKQGPNFAYIPIAVPSKYIVGIVLPKQVENNENLRNFLSDTFNNATIISSSGKTIKPLESEFAL